MTTPEQQARDMLELMGADELIEELANLIAERDALKAELAAIKRGAGEPYCYVYEWLVSPGVWHRSLSPDKYNGRDCDSFIGLYTRPCVPLTDEKVKELILEHFLTGENQFNEVHQDYRFRSPATERNVWGRDLLKFARAIEAHIKGAKG